MHFKFRANPNIKFVELAVFFFLPKLNAMITFVKNQLVEFDYVISLKVTVRV